MSWLSIFRAAPTGQRIEIIFVKVSAELVKLYKGSLILQMLKITAFNDRDNDVPPHYDHMMYVSRGFQEILHLKKHLVLMMEMLIYSGSHEPNR